MSASRSRALEPEVRSRAVRARAVSRRNETSLSTRSIAGRAWREFGKAKPSMRNRSRPSVRWRPSVDLLDGRLLLSQSPVMLPAIPHPFSSAAVGPSAGNPLTLTTNSDISSTIDRSQGFRSSADANFGPPSPSQVWTQPLSGTAGSPVAAIGNRPTSASATTGCVTVTATADQAGSRFVEPRAVDSLEGMLAGQFGVTAIDHGQGDPSPLPAFTGSSGENPGNPVAGAPSARPAFIPSDDSISQSPAPPARSGFAPAFATVILKTSAEITNVPAATDFLAVLVPGVIALPTSFAVESSAMPDGRTGSSPGFEVRTASTPGSLNISLIVSPSAPFNDPPAGTSPAESPLRGPQAQLGSSDPQTATRREVPFKDPVLRGAGLIAELLPFDRATFDESLSRFLDMFHDEDAPTCERQTALPCSILFVTAALALEGTRRWHRRLAAAGTNDEWIKGSPTLHGLS